MPFFTRIVGPFPRRGIKKSKVFGHCRYHGMDITFRQSKRMKCLEKNCRKLKPNWEHPEWKKMKRGCNDAEGKDGRNGAEKLG